MKIKTFTLILLSIFFTISMYSQVTTPFIVVDQFGYLPQAKKVAVIRVPQIGFDSLQSFSPGNSYALVNAVTSAHIFTAQPTQWNNGKTDPSSGDKCWWFDFSSVSTTGTYYIVCEGFSNYSGNINMQISISNASKSDQTETNVTTSINNSPVNNIDVYPNPASNFFTIKSNYDLILISI